MRGKQEPRNFINMGHSSFYFINHLHVREDGETVKVLLAPGLVRVLTSPGPRPLPSVRVKVWRLVRGKQLRSVSWSATTMEVRVQANILYLY